MHNTAVMTLVKCSPTYIVLWLSPLTLFCKVEVATLHVRMIQKQLMATLSGPNINRPISVASKYHPPPVASCVQMMSTCI